MPTTDVVRTRDEGVAVAHQIAAIERQLPDAVAAGAVDDIAEMAHRADAMRLYEQAKGHAEAAASLTKLRIRCDAALGVIDIQGAEAHGPGFVDDGSDRKRTTRRVFAVAFDRGTLNDVFAECEAQELEITDASVRQLIGRRGDAYVPREVLREAVLRWAKGRGVVIRQGSLPGHATRRGGMRYIASELGVPYTTVTGIVGFKTSSRARVSWWNAKRIADIVGLPTSGLPKSPLPKRGKARPDRWLKRQHKPTGSKWDECYSRLRKTLDEFQRLAPNTLPQYDEAYEHFYALNALIEKKVRLGEKA